MAIVVFGASGGTGKAIIQASLGKGCPVKAFVRVPSSLEPRDGLRIIQGDVAHKPGVSRAIAAGDRVVVTLGNSQNPLRRMLGEPRTTARDVCSIGTCNVIAAMTAAGARRLIVVSAFGVGATRERASRTLRLFYAFLLREQMADKEQQERLVRASRLDWTIVQPVALTEDAPVGRWTASLTGDVDRMKIGRHDLAAFIVAELLQPVHVNATVTLSSGK